MKNLLTALALLFGCCANCAASDWHMVNVNTTSQGDAHLITDSGVNTLIDAGQFHLARTELVPYLRRQGVRTIHHFYISHPHTDHYSGLWAIMAAGIKVENIYHNRLEPEISDFNYKPDAYNSMLESARRNGAQIHNVKKGHKVEYGKTEIKILLSSKGHGHGSVNDYSLVMRVVSNGVRILFTGDLNYKAGQMLCGDESMKADIMKVPHHGVTGIAPDCFFDTVDASLLMYPSTRVLWNHPRGKQARDWTMESKTMYCHNGLNGNVVVNLSNGRATPRSEESTPRCSAIQAKEYAPDFDVKSLAHIYMLLLDE